MLDQPTLFCRGCGSILNYLEIPRCPECGRGYDPAWSSDLQKPWPVERASWDWRTGWEAFQKWGERTMDAAAHAIYPERE